MHKIIFFIEPPYHEFHTPSKIANMFMNRCAIDEDASFEILKIFELSKSVSYNSKLLTLRLSGPKQGENQKRNRIITTKEKFDREVINAAFKYISYFGNDDLSPHFIYCGNEYWDRYGISANDYLKSTFLAKMEKYKMKSSILTMLNMERLKLVTQKIVKGAYQGKFKKVSIHESLETFFMKLRNQDIKEESVSYAA